MHQLDMPWGADDREPGAPAFRARAKAREADWRRQLARAYAYQAARSPEDAEELLREYERREAEGPDFMRVRPRSVFEDAPVVTLDRNERVRLMGKFRALSRGSWVAKAKGKHRGVITRTAEAVFEALLYLVEKYGRVFPSLEGLAHLARCCRASVATALDDLELLGFVTRIRRVRRVQTPLGFKVVQVTNAYQVHEPVSGLGLLASILCGKPTGSNYWRASETHCYPRRTNAGLYPDHEPVGASLARSRDPLHTSDTPEKQIRS
jgi:hypothetical protein